VQLGAVPQGLTVRIETPAELLLPGCGLAQQAAVADLPDVAGLKVHLDREAVLELEELRRVDDGTRVVLGQRLLRWR
jgi:hypothetical protein